MSGRTPWRRRERRPLGQLPRWRLYVVFFPVMAWVMAVRGPSTVVTGGRTPADDRALDAVGYRLVALAVAVPLTWLVWAYVRRPVKSDEHGADPERARADRVRDDDERTAWRSR